MNHRPFEPPQEALLVESAPNTNEPKYASTYKLHDVFELFL